VPLTIFHLVALLLVVGIGVNYALFAERLLREPGEATRVLRTLSVVSATTLCAFATLAVSSHPGAARARAYGVRGRARLPRARGARVAADREVGA
jgi:predicted exporter